MILVSPMAPASGPAARALPARAAGPGLSGGGGGRRGPAAQPSSAAGRGASSLVLRPLPGPSAACRRRGRRFRSPLSRLCWRRRLFRWPRPCRLLAAARSTPRPRPRRGSAPARAHPRLQPSRAGRAADGLALGRTPQTPRPATLRCSAPARWSQAQKGAWRRSPTLPRMEGQISPAHVPGLFKALALDPRGIGCFSTAGEGCNVGVALLSEKGRGARF